MRSMQCVLMICLSVVSFPALADDVIIGSPLLQGKLPAGDGSSSPAATYDDFKFNVRTGVAVGQLFHGH